MANYPSDPDVDAGYRRQGRSSSTPSANRWLPPLDDRTAREPHSHTPPPTVGADDRRAACDRYLCALPNAPTLRSAATSQ